MKKVAGKGRLQHLIANYTHGYSSAENRKEGHKVQSTGSDPIYYEGERDANESGRSQIAMTTDMDSVEARLIMRLRKDQTSKAFLELPAAHKMQHLAREGQKVLDEVEDDDDFEPYSQRKREELGQANQTQEQLAAANQAAAEAHARANVAERATTDAEQELQALKRQAAEDRHGREQAEREVQRLKAEAANKPAAG